MRLPGLRGGERFFCLFRFFFFFLLLLFKRFMCVALAVQELALYDRFSTKKETCLPLPPDDRTKRAVIKGI